MTTSGAVRARRAVVSTGLVLAVLGLLLRELSLCCVGVGVVGVALGSAWPRLRALGWVGGLVLTLGLAEGALQLRAPAPSFWMDWPDDFFIRGGELGRLGRPGVHAHAKGVAGGEAFFDVRYTIADDGFRVTPGPEGPARVRVLGCSNAFGWGLDDDATLAARLAEGLGVPVANDALPGWGVHEPLVLLTESPSPAGTVHVLLTAAWHASRAGCRYHWSLGAPRFRLSESGEVLRDGRCGVPGSTTRVGGVLARSQVAEALREAAMVWGQARDLERYLALVEAIAARVRASEGRLVVAYMRTTEGYFRDPGDSDDAILQALAQVADEVVDVTLAPRIEVLPERYRLHALDRHPSAEANRRRAELLAPAVRRALEPAEP